MRLTAATTSAQCHLRTSPLHLSFIYLYSLFYFLIFPHFLIPISFVVVMASITTTSDRFIYIIRSPKGSTVIGRVCRRRGGDNDAHSRIIGPANTHHFTFNLNMLLLFMYFFFLYKISRKGMRVPLTKAVFTVHIIREWNTFWTWVVVEVYYYRYLSPIESGFF